MKASETRIVSVDGEGKAIDGRHAYTMLAAADDRGFRDRILHDGTKREAIQRTADAVGNSDIPANYGLTTKRNLDFLLGLPGDSSDLIISFSFVYDQTKFLQDLPWGNLIEFGTYGITEWNGYIISGIPRKHFSVRRGDRECVVWDAFSYWQMGFVKVLDSSLDLFTADQLVIIEQIRKMKDKRPDEAEWAAMSVEETLAYCYSECEFLSILYRDILTNCEHFGLDPTRHSGPGAMAEAFFRSVNLLDYMPDDTGHYQAGLPSEVAIHSVFGGHFETSILGPVGDVIEDDIQSAYPAEAVNMPCLRHGRFRKVSEYVPNRLGFYFVESRTSGPWAPFPFRVSKETSHLFNGAAPGAIVYPHGGRGWRTSAEVAVARKHFGDDAIPIIKGYVFDPGCNHKPFAKLQELYNNRKIGDPTCSDCLNAEELFCDRHPSPSEGMRKFIKLILNSIYGKLLQGIGWRLVESSQYGSTVPESYKAPMFQCYIWAAWITGGTRAKVMDAALRGGDSVVSIATDGILSTKPIPDQNVTKWELGTWERKPKKDCWLGMPGIYAFGKNPSEKDYKRRGLSSRYFPAWYLRQQFEQGELIVKPIETPIGFMPLKLAIMRKDGFDTMGEWVVMKKTVKFLSVQHKRNLADDPFMLPAGSPIKLIPFTIPNDVVSAPFKPKQTWEDVRDGIVIMLNRAADNDIPMWDVEDIGTDWEG
jgi:hypothetical protein